MKEGTLYSVFFYKKTLKQTLECRLSSIIHKSSSKLHMRRRFLSRKFYVVHVLQIVFCQVDTVHELGDGE